jgi:hypothetical protein
MTISVADLINNIENGTLSDAEQVFNDIMDLKAGQAIDAYREKIASGIFGDSQEFESEDSDENFEDEQDLEDDFAGDEDEDV